MKRVLVLSSTESKKNKKAFEVFINEISRRLGSSIALDPAHYKDLFFFFNQSEMEVINLNNGTDLSGYDFVYLKSYYRYDEIATSVAEYLEFKRVGYVCSELSSYISHSKVSQYAKMASAGIPIPKTVYFHSSSFSRVIDRVEPLIRAPFICKATDAEGGDLNFLLSGFEKINSTFKQHSGIEFVLQEFIPNDFDVRCLIVNKKAELLIKRARQDARTHLNNTSQGSAASLISRNTFGEINIKLAEKAADLFGREIAGVDVLIRRGDNRPFVLEVNASPQVSTGSYAEKKIEIYADFIKKSVDIR